MARIPGITRLSRGERGFTLVEVLVATMMMVMVLFALYAMFDMSLRVFKIGNSEVEANQNARVAIDRMEREIRSAWKSETSCSSPDSSYDLIKDSSDSNSISFYNCFANSGSPTLISYSVDISNNSLQRSQDNGAPQKVADLGAGDNLKLEYCNVGMSCNTFSSPDTTYVEITLKVEDGGRTQTLNTIAGLRNNQ